MEIIQGSVPRVPWNKGKLVGQKAPLKQREIWAIRIRLQLAERTRELALFNLAMDSKLRSCDLVRLRVRDVAHGEQIGSRAIVMQQKTHRPVQFGTNSRVARGMDGVCGPATGGFVSMSVPRNKCTGVIECHVA